MCIYICCSATNGGDGVQGSVSADAKVRARDVVGYGGRHNHNGNAHFLIFLPSLHQLKASNIRLQQKRRRRFIFFSVLLVSGTSAHFEWAEEKQSLLPLLTSKPPMITKAWMLNLAMFWLISSNLLPGRVLREYRIHVYFPNIKSKKQKCIFLPLGAQHWTSFSSPATHRSPDNGLDL